MEKFGTNLKGGGMRRKKRFEVIGHYISYILGRGHPFLQHLGFIIDIFTSIRA